MSEDLAGVANEVKQQVKLFGSQMHFVSLHADAACLDVNAKVAASISASSDSSVAGVDARRSAARTRANNSSIPNGLGHKIIGA